MINLRFCSLMFWRTQGKSTCRHIGLIILAQNFYFKILFINVLFIFFHGLQRPNSWLLDERHLPHQSFVSLHFDRLRTLLDLFHHFLLHHFEICFHQVKVFHNQKWVGVTLLNDRQSIRIQIIEANHLLKSFIFFAAGLFLLLTRFSCGLFSAISSEAIVTHIGVLSIV